MYKKLVFLILLGGVLKAGSVYTMYASKVESYEDKFFASGSVVIYYDKKVVRAKSAFYDRKKKILQLKGDVVAIDSNSTTKSDYLYLKLDTKLSQSKRFFIYDTTEGIWLRGSDYKGKDGVFIVKNSEVSSCSVKDPDWKIVFDRAKYNKNKEFITLKNPTFYFKDKPVFALPWFAFPTIKTRKTGLLRPKFGVKVDSGFIYMQPYFYAPSKSWDLEITPQIRTNRGVGVYSTYRFVDSAYSKGKVTFGGFYDKRSFYEEKDLKNISHYGFDISYESHYFFKKFLNSKSKDGLWLDFHYLNDIDYENLKDINIKSLNKLVTSRFNYFLKRDRDYFGFYAKYFIDTDKESNSDTLQELPSFQYHRFTTNLPIRNLIYSVDYKVKNNYRREGLNALMHEINFPIKLDIPLFSNYVNLSFSENLYFSKIQYSKKSSVDMDNATYFSNYHKLILSSDLLKPYDSFLHNLQLEMSLQIPSFEDKTGDIADFITINKEEKNLKYSINQYFYNYDEYNFLVFRTDQIIFLDKDGRDKYGDIFNELIYHYSKHLTFHENFEISCKYKKIKKVQSTIDYKKDSLKLNISHTYESLPSKKVNYITSSLGLDLGKGFEFEAELDYDIENTLARSWSMKLFRDKRCWDYSIKYKESVTPIFTSAGVQSYKNKGLYFLVNFANIGGISYEYSQDDISSSGE